MLHQRMSSLLKNKIFLISILFIVFLLTRISGIPYDTINPDGVNWHYRSEQFVVGLKYAQFDKTYQHYHPGVTLMWITGIPIEIYKQISGITVYDSENFFNFHFVAKLSLIISHILLMGILYFVSKKSFGFKRTYLLLAFLVFEPFIIGNSRIYHMDLLFSEFLMIGLILSYQNLKDFSYLKTVLSGLFMALTFLTKSIGIGLPLFVILFPIIRVIQDKDWKFFLKYSLGTLLSFSFFTLLLFPALWTAPIETLVSIFKEGERVGVRKGHEQTILGETTTDGGFFFYPLVLLMKQSPILVFGFLAYMFSLLKSIKGSIKGFKSIVLSPTFYMAVFFLGYILVMTYSTKKIDRYMLPVMVFISYLASIGILNIYRNVKNKIVFAGVGVISIILFWIISLVTYYPYYFLYTSPLFGSSDNANSIIAQKPFGIGITEVRDYIVSTYGEDTDIAFIDTKPIKMIYPNSQVFDSRVAGTGSYDYLILGVNEEFPEHVYESSDEGVSFEKVHSLYFHGLEFWRIYEKRNTN